LAAAALRAASSSAWRRATAMARAARKGLLPVREPEIAAAAASWLRTKEKQRKENTHTHTRHKKKKKKENRGWDG